MSSTEGEGLPAEVAEELEEHGLAEPVMVRDRKGRWHKAVRATRKAVIIILVLAIAAMALLWSERRPLADNAIRKELAKRGVRATYHLDKVGLRTQQISNLVIGDPANPDLVARLVQVKMRVLLSGKVEVYGIVARGVRLNGRVIGGKVSWGEIDKLLPPPSGKPFRLPDIALDVDDATLRLATPYGPLGVAVRGSGNLSGGFKGRAAVSGPRLRPGRCQLDALKANVAVEIEARKPHIAGPLSAARFACPPSRIAIDQPRMEVDSVFAEGFDQFDGKGRLSFAAAVIGSNGLAGATSHLTFKGTPSAIEGRIDVAAQRARLAQILADRTHIKGWYRLGAAAGTADLVADYDASGVALDPAMTASLTDALKGAARTPVGPIAAAMAEAIRRTSADFDVNGKLLLLNRPGEGLVRVERADAHGRGGAHILVGGGGDGVSYAWPSGRIRIDGDIRTQGGGLPDARIHLDSPRGGGPMSGVADVAPYAAGGARLALAPVRFTGLADGGTRIETIALLDGRMPDGWVRGLRLPIRGRFGGAGGLAIGEGCVDARFQALQYGALKLGPTRLPLCPNGGGALLRQAPGGPLRIAAQTNNLQLAGSLGKAAMRLTAARLASIGDRAFEAAALSLRLGKLEAPVAIDAARLKGTFKGKGVSGTYAGARATIGNVPLLLSDSEGRWKVYNGDISVDGRMMVSDRATDARFEPLLAPSVHFTLADDWIRAQGPLVNPASGALVSNVTIEHRLSSGKGEALLDVPGIRFRQGGLQPTDLTRLAEGVIALVDGEVNGRGRIAWDGDGKVRSTGDFHVVDTNLAAAFGPLTGVNTTIHFTDLLGLQTAPGQVLTMKTVNPGILVEDGTLTYSLLPDRLVKIERGEWPFMGGRLILRETILNFNRPTPKRLTFEVVGLDAHSFVESMGFQEIGASGIFDGVLPMVFDETGGRIVGGRLDSRPGGGTLQYNGVVNRANLGLMARLAFDALRDLRFRSMIVRLDGYLDGEFATRLTIDQVGLGNTSTQQILKSINRVPFKFNVTIKGPFRALIATAKSFRDPTAVISPVLPVPLEDVPGIIVETRRLDAQQQQTQAPAAPRKR